MTDGSRSVAQQMGVGAVEWDFSWDSAYIQNLVPAAGVRSDHTVGSGTPTMGRDWAFQSGSDDAIRHLRCRNHFWTWCSSGLWGSICSGTQSPVVV